MTIAPGLELAEEALIDICRPYRIKELMVFGSAARGEMRPESDVDLLVEFLPESNTGLFEPFQAEMELSNLFGKKVDLVSKRALREGMRRAILPEARSIYAA